jgi:hypothetical protein
MSHAIRCAILFALAGLALIVAPSASAEVPIQSFGLLPSSTQAGGHPDLQFGFALKNAKRQQADGNNTPCDCENPNHVTIHAPAGLVGIPHAYPRCTTAQLLSITCPVDSQVGVVEAGLSTTPADDVPITLPVFNMIPRNGEAGLLAFALVGTPVFEIFDSRTDSDYGLDTTFVNYNGLPTGFGNQILWGVPADPVHDVLRFAFEEGEGIFQELCDASGVFSLPSTAGPTASPAGPHSATRMCGPTGIRSKETPSNSPLRPFIQAPTTCGIPLTSFIEVHGFDGTTTHGSADYPATTGCDQLSFNPSLAAKPTTTEADAPSGMDIDLTVPQFQSPATPSPSQIRASTVTLPPGFTINPNAADGKTACMDFEANFGTLAQAQCPESAKIGTLEIESALLPGPLPGYMYIGQPLPGTRYRVFLVADGFEVHVKLAGTLVPDPVTGQLSITFTNLPQTPFARFVMHIFGSERGSLATPTRCGTYEVTSTFTPWNSILPDQTSKQTFTLDSGPGGKPCPGSPRPFDPSFEAASASNTAGAHSTFAADFVRADGDQFLTAIEVTEAPGAVASLKGVPYCPEATIDQLQATSYSGLAELASPACPADSQIGTVVAGAGAGSRPIHVSGKLYLAGPYKGAPLSLLVVIPAVSGPYDLGVVATRAAIEVDPLTARVTAVSDPLPQIIGGIPLRTRRVQVSLDRPGFAINPTSCDASSVDATMTADEGTTARHSVHYQVANCAALSYAPRLSLVFTGGVRRRGHPAIHATVTTAADEANSRSISVTLPKGLLLDQSHIRTICTRVNFAADACPSGSRIGKVQVDSPLLDQPLSGSAYLRSSKQELPDLALDLEGQFDIEAIGHIDSVNGRLRTTFDSIPDVPVSRIDLDLVGGAKGLLQNTESLCGKSRKASVRMIGQNGARLNPRVEIRPACGKDARRRRPGDPQRGAAPR